MANIASKNQYELLGNDPELDPDREPEPPTKAIDKPAPRIGKRNAGAEGPSPDTARPKGGGRGGRHEVFTGSEQAFRDRTAGASNNRSKLPDDGLRGDRHPDRLRGPNEHRDIDGRPRGSRGGYRGQGYRGTRTGRDDRHSRTGVQDHEKQVAHGWGGNTGKSELADEKVGEQIAKEEEKEGFDTVVPPPVNAEGETWVPEGTDTTWAPDTTADSTGVDSSAPAPEAEPEDKTKSYADYLAELAEKKLALGGDKLDPRKPNEGGSKKFPEGKAFTRDEGEDYVAGSGGKAKRDRQRKEKTMVELDNTRLREAPREPFSGRGRGRGRGEGGFRGEGRGRGGRGGGRGGERGGFRGDRGDRGDFRGGRGGRGDRGPAGPNVADTNAFPELGK